MQRKLTSLILIALLGVGTVTLAACDNEGPAEKAGEKVDNATDKAKDTMDDAGDKMKDSMDDAKDKAQDATNSN